MAIAPLNSHYSMENPATIYDEESLTALQLAARTTGKVNEVVENFNRLDSETSAHLAKQDAAIPVKVSEAVDDHIRNGSFDQQIDAHTSKVIRQIEESEQGFEEAVETLTADYASEVADLNREVNARLNTLLGVVSSGSTSLDAELIDLRTGADGQTYATAGEALRSLYMCADFNAIDSTDYKTRCPSINNLYRPCILRFNFDNGSSDIPEGFPWDKWSGGFNTLFVCNTNAKGSTYYCSQILFNNDGIYYRYCGANFPTNWLCISGGENDKTLISASNYKERLPSANIGYGSTLRLLFADGSTDIPSDLPFDKWEGSLATLITTETVGSGVYYSTQILFTSRNIYYRFAGNEYMPWFCMTRNMPPDGVVTEYESSSILEGVKRCYSKGVTRLVVEAGDYDIIEEYKNHYGDNYFVDYKNYWTGDYYDRGIWLENIEIIFSPGARVKCHYTGNNAGVIDYFSAFAVGNNVTVNGLVLDSSFIRYGVHPDFNTGADLSTMTFRNCEFTHFKNQYNEQAIGCGFGLHVNWTFENCIFHTRGKNAVVRIHNKGSDGAQSKVTFKGCYIDGEGYFLLNAYGSSEYVSNCIVTGCSFITPPVKGVENVNTETTNPENMKLIAFNNEVRK